RHAGALAVPGDRGLFPGWTRPSVPVDHHGHGRRRLPARGPRLKDRLVNWAVVGIVFPTIFLAELPDKTALASLVLGTRYRPLYVFCGMAAAFVVHVVLAVSAGSLLFLLPHRVVQAIVAALFAVGAFLMLRRRDDDEDPEVHGLSESTSPAGDEPPGRD